jgi:hypothetical protein
MEPGVQSITSAGLLNPEAWALGLGLMLLALPVLIAAGAVGMSFCIALSGWAGGKVFADKLSKQLAEFGIMVLGGWLLLVSVRWGLWAASWWPTGEVAQVFYPLFFDIPGHLALLFTLVSIALVRFRRRSRRTTWVHLALGAICVFVWSATLAAFVAGAFQHLDNAVVETKLSLYGFAAAMTTPLAWLAWGQLFFLGLAAGAGFGLLYLLAKRNKEDYGRDYYCWSVKHCAWWAFLTGIIHAGLVKAVFWCGAVAREERTDLAGAGWISEAIQAFVGHETTPVLVLALSLGLAACLCLVPVLRTQTPLRMKGWILVHAGLFMLGVAAVCRMYGDLF